MTCGPCPAANVLYPKRFEIFRLEALGDDPYHSPEEAQTLYDEGRGLSVVAEGEPPSWFLDISVDRYRFSVTFYAPSRTPIRSVTWEQESGQLICRRTIDRFYPDGDPGRRIPDIDIVTVTQQISSTGEVEVSPSSAAADDSVRVAAGSADDYRLPVPEFGDWHPIIVASAPAVLERFGLDSIDAAIEYADSVAVGMPTSICAGLSPSSSGDVSS